MNTITPYDKASLEAELFPLLSLLTEQGRELILQSAIVVEYKPGELIYREGESPDQLLCTIDGRVKIFRHGVGGRNQIVRLMRPGGFFGYRARLAGEPYVTAAAAFDAVRICAIPMDLIERLMAESIPLCRFLISELSTDLGIADQRIVSLTQKHLRGRLAEALLMLRDTFGTDHRSHCLDIRLSREDIGGLANMTTSNAIRTLAAFAEEGLVALDGKSIRLLKEEELLHISACG